MLISLIIPVYRNEASIPDLMLAIEELNCHFKKDMETIFVIDGSPDRSYEILQEILPQQNFHSKLILLSKNFGAFAAVRMGLQVSKGRYFAVMAADLQEPLELIYEMVAALRKDQVDIALGIRNKRHDPLLTRIPAQLFWAFYRRYVVRDMPPGGVDVFACNQMFRDNLLQLDEQHSSLIAQIFWLGFKRKYISYTRKKRLHGKSAWTFHRKFKYLMDSIFSFTDLPIRLLIRMGGFGVICSSLLGFIVFIARISNAINFPGYTITLLTIIFMGALNLFGLGIIGSYAWRTYENTKKRPLAIVIKTQTFEGKYNDMVFNSIHTSPCNM